MTEYLEAQFDRQERKGGCVDAPDEGGGGGALPHKRA